MVQSVAPKPGEIVLLSGHDLRRLLNPEVVIEALREAYAALADNRGDQGRSVDFTIEGGSIHVKSGLLPGSHLAFASKVNVNLPDNWKLRQLPTIQGVVVVSDAKDGRPLAIMENRGHGSPRSGIWCSKAFKAGGHHRLRSPSQVSTRSRQGGSSPGNGAGV
jgi:ornithine cyclodeaminase/alanine dehydrogenase-like protein (mu-crystallin family)